MAWCWGSLCRNRVGWLGARSEIEMEASYSTLESGSLVGCRRKGSWCIERWMWDDDPDIRYGGRNRV